LKLFRMWVKVSNDEVFVACENIDALKNLMEYVYQVMQILQH
jgi:hypothetical protein